MKPGDRVLVFDVDGVQWPATVTSRPRASSTKTWMKIGVHLDASERYPRAGHRPVPWPLDAVRPAPRRRRDR